MSEKKEKYYIIDLETSDTYDFKSKGEAESWLEETFKRELGIDESSFLIIKGIKKQFNLPVRTEIED